MFLLGIILLCIVIIILIIYISYYFYKLDVITPSKLTCKTYYKCLEKNHNIPTTAVLEKYNLQRLNKNINPDLYIPCGYNLVEEELNSLRFVNKNMIIYGIIGCDLIVSKNGIWNILEEYYGRYEASNMMPKTYIVGNIHHMKELNKSHQYGKKYILKKNIQRKKGLLITSNIKHINSINHNDFKIIQTYIYNPLLINKRKLNIRIYVAVVYKDNTITMYMYKEGKCLYTARDYSNDTIEDEIHNMARI